MFFEEEVMEEGMEIAVVGLLTIFVDLFIDGIEGSNLFLPNIYPTL